MHEQNTAQVTGRALLVGTLKLESPLLIGAGAGERDSDRDIQILKTKDGAPFIPGTSLCGVLREFLLAQVGDHLVETIFGDADNGQSMINIEDVVLTDGKIASRDGVSIDGLTGVGVDNAKYDYEVVEPGAGGDFRLLLTRRACHENDWQEIRDCFLLLRDKLEDGIALGAVTAKGFGKVKAEKARTGFYDFHKAEDVCAWLEQPDPQPDKASDRMQEKSTKALGATGDLVVEADFALRTSVIVRDYGREKAIPNSKEDGKTFNAVSLMRKDGKYILPGTSLKGVLRHHAEHILRRLGVDDGVLREMMGYSEKDTSGEDAKQKSRFMVEESVLEEASFLPAAQTRIRIDRFTGSVIDSALLVNEPLWQKDAAKPAFRLRFTIRKAEKPEEIGLALFLLRDLWQGKVAVGGEKSVGRGTLQGLGGSIKYYKKDAPEIYTLDKNGKVADGKSGVLEEYAKALLRKAKKEAAAK